MNLLITPSVSIKPKDNLEDAGKGKRRSQSLIQKSPVHMPGSLGNRDVMRRLTGLLRPVMTASNCSEPSPLDTMRIRRQMARTYVRIRPQLQPTPASMLGKRRKWLKVNSSNVVQVTPPPAASSSLNGQPRLPSRDIEYQFRQVLTEDTSQSSTFRIVSGPALDQLFHGGCGLILCTGAAHSGKTYTMLGHDKDNKDWGLVRRTFEAIFKCVENELTESNLIQAANANTYIMMTQVMGGGGGGGGGGIGGIGGGAMGKNNMEPAAQSVMRLKRGSSSCKFHSVGVWQMRSGKHIISQQRRYACFISMLEVFGTMVHDLLDDKIGERSAPLFILEDELGRSYAGESQRLQARNVTEAMEILNTGLRRRESLGGKSHLIVNIYLPYVNYNSQLDSYELLNAQDKIKWGQLTLIDMLSPRSVEIDARECANVTQMLLSLRSCLAVLRYNQQAILKGKSVKRSPSCRDARLSQLLKHYFDVTQPATTVCLTCITQESEDIHENMRALKLAENVREIIRPRGSESITTSGHLTPNTNEKLSPSLIPSASMKGKVMPPIPAARREKSQVLLPSIAGKIGGFINKSFMLDYEAIVATPPIQLPSFEQVSGLNALLKSLIQRRNELISYSETKWSEFEMSRILTLASSNVFRDQLREIDMAQKSAIEILKECIQETQYCLVELHRIFDPMRYQEFCSTLLMPVEKRGQLVENLLTAHNEQMEHYANIMTSKTKTSNDFTNINSNSNQLRSPTNVRPKWRKRATSVGDPKGRSPDEAARAKQLEQRSIRSSATLMRMGVWRY